MKRRYSQIIVFSILILFITSAAWSELPTANPEDVGLSSDRLNTISVTLKAHIEKGVIPGAVVMVARDGKVAYFESYGMRDLESSSPMQKDTIFQAGQEVQKWVPSPKLRILLKTIIFIWKTTDCNYSTIMFKSLVEEKLKSNQLARKRTLIMKKMQSKL